MTAEVALYYVEEILSELQPKPQSNGNRDGAKRNSAIQIIHSWIGTCAIIR